MSEPFAVGCLGLAIALAGRSRSRETPAVRATAAADRGHRHLTPGRLAAAALGLAAALLVGGPLGAPVGLAAFLGTDRAVRSLEPADVRRRKEQRAAELPLVLDLLAVCLRAGTPLVIALETVAAALPGRFSDDLALVAGLQRLGCGASAAWAELADDPDLGPVARAVGRSAESGARLAAAFERLAADRRSGLAAAGEARARRAGVLAMAPLGLCFLPAFVSLGIVPIVLSLADAVLP